MGIKSRAKNEAVDIVLPKRLFDIWINSFKKTKEKIRSRLNEQIIAIHETTQKKFKTSQHVKKMIKKKCSQYIIKLINTYVAKDI